MTVDELLRSLSKLPRPAPGAFFAVRTAALATAAPEKPRRSIILYAYWVLVTFIAGSMLLDSWSGLAVIVAACFVGAFPEGTLRVLLRVAGPFLPMHADPMERRPLRPPKR